MLVAGNLLVTNTVPEHVPVLAGPVLDHFAGLGEGVFVDCTLGLGGHARLILERNPTIRLLALDLDEANLAVAGSRLREFADRIILKKANFADLNTVLAETGVERAVGLLADLGVSSNQIADPARGLSFEVDGPLDMRLDRDQPTTAADVLRSLDERELADLIYLQSQERHSRRIAWRIAQALKRGPLNSTIVLARLVAAATGHDRAGRRGRIHPATRTFMALRMAVNQELGNLRRLLEQAPACLARGGRLAVITFHSGEDRLVKEDLRTRARLGEYRLLTKRPIAADDAEAAANPRSRSAKLRVAERC